MGCFSAVLGMSFLLLVAGTRGCFVPPHGCKTVVCDMYVSMTIPPNNGDFSKPKAWTGQLANLAFVRSAFNKNLGPRGPSAFTAQSWLDLLKGYNGSGQVVGAGGPPGLPSLNYEFYDLAGATNKSDAPDTVKDPVTGTVYQSNASVGHCCHACRLSAGCPMYAYMPYGAQGDATSVAGGKCFFVTSGGESRDGPFDFADGKNKFSPRTVNLNAPVALSRSDTASKLKTPTLFPTYFQVFLGGYCNPWVYPNGTVTDDPHFTGAHGTRFDFNGELNKAFCLLTDRKVALNAVLKGYKSDNSVGATVGRDGKAVRSWIKELGLLWTDGLGKEHSLHLVARSGKEMARGAGFLASAAVDGTLVAIPSEEGASYKDGDLTFTYWGTMKRNWFDFDKFQVRVGNGFDLSFNMRAAHPKLQAPDDAEVHFNLMFNEVKVTDKVHGVLGQTYRTTPDQVAKAVKYQELNKLLGGPVKADGKSGAGFLEGSVSDYEATHVLKADCKVSSYEML